MAIVDFPTAKARETTARARLAAYLRDLANAIEANEAEIEPAAALIVLTGPAEHEVVCCGYRDDAYGFREAAQVAGYVTRELGFPTIGRNRRNRGDYGRRPLRHDNIVDGAFPAKRSDPHA